MLTVKQHLDAYAKMMRQRRAAEEKQWEKYWEGKLKNGTDYSKYSESTQI
jgi:hypothetical protein